MDEINKVRLLQFSDLYLGHPQLGDLFSDVPGAEVNPLPANPKLHDDLVQLKAMCREAAKGVTPASEFKVRHDGTAYRVSIMNTLGGEVFVLRRIADSIPTLAEIGIPAAYIPRLMARDLSGLFIVSGSIKAGKTMTACAMVKERLAAYGGIAVTAEEPIELPLEGRYGQGVCYQTQVSHRENGFVEAFRHVIRWGAKIIFIGEICDPDAAVEVLQASVNGHLVISTMNAENVIQTITKLDSLANEKLAQNNAQTLIADGLAGVLHQRVVRDSKKKIETEFLFLRDAPLVKSTIRNGKYETLGTDIRQQMASMIHVSASASRNTGA